jgi:hypothetical protein
VCPAECCARRRIGAHTRRTIQGTKHAGRQPRCAASGPAIRNTKVPGSSGVMTPARSSLGRLGDLEVVDPAIKHDVLNLHDPRVDTPRVGLLESLSHTMEPIRIDALDGLTQSWVECSAFACSVVFQQHEHAFVAPTGRPELNRSPDPRRERLQEVLEACVVTGLAGPCWTRSTARLSDSSCRIPRLAGSKSQARRASWRGSAPGALQRHPERTR